MQVQDQPAYTLRTATAADAPLLFELFAQEKRAELAPLNLTPEQSDQLLRMQYGAREFTWSANTPGAVDLILCLPDGTPTGRHLIQENPEGLRSIDIAVLPQFRGRGIAAWSLRRLQAIGEQQGTAVTLRVLKDNPALHLYRRLGFAHVSEDEISFEMRWEPGTLRAPKPAPPAVAHDIPALTGGLFTRDSLIDTVVAFLREIGLTVDFAPVQNAIVPGIDLIPGGLRIDRNTLLFPGDLLHEAGRLAVMTPEDRAEHPLAPPEPAFQIAAIAWAWAAAFRLGIPDHVVIHDNAYKGLAPNIRSDFAHGKAPGLPVLAWVGMTTMPTAEAPSIYPQMLQWLRTAEVPTLA